MEFQVDIIDRLVRRQMFFIAEDIFTRLDDKSLRQCELVSKSWYLVIRNGKIWKKNYEKEARQQPLFHRTLLQRGLHQLNNKDLLYKKLCRAKENVLNNWDSETYLKTTITIGELNVVCLAMDAKRIVLGVSSCQSNPNSSILVYDSSTLERECVLMQPPTEGFIKHLQLLGELVICSFYSQTIIIWDLKTRQVVRQLNDNIDGGSVQVIFCVAHDWLISCFNISPDVLILSDRFDARITVRRMRSPADMTIEKTEDFPNCKIEQLEADDNLFAICLRVSQSCKLQLRSRSHFQVIHEIEMTPAFKWFSLQYDRLLTIERNPNNGKNLVKCWNIDDVFKKCSPSSETRKSIDLVWRKLLDYDEDPIVFSNAFHLIFCKSCELVYLLNNSFGKGFYSLQLCFKENWGSLHAENKLVTSNAFQVVTVSSWPTQLVVRDFLIHPAPI